MNHMVYEINHTVVADLARPEGEQFMQVIKDDGPVITWGPLTTARHFSTNYAAIAHLQTLAWTGKGDFVLVGDGIGGKSRYFTLASLSIVHDEAKIVELNALGDYAHHDIPNL